MASFASSSSLNPQLEALVQAFEQAKAEARRLLTSSSEELLRKRPSPNSWSALECVGHLNLGNEMMLKNIKQTITRAPELPKTPNRKYKMDLIGRLMVWSFEPGRIKLKAPAAIAKPVVHGGAQEALAEFERHQNEAVELIRSAAGLAIDRCKMKSPFANIRYSAYSAFGIIAAHNRRHLWQARNAVNTVAKS
jgi:DinB superfamily